MSWTRLPCGCFSSSHPLLCSFTNQASYDFSRIRVRGDPSINSRVRGDPSTKIARIHCLPQLRRQECTDRVCSLSSGDGRPRIRRAPRLRRAEFVDLVCSSTPPMFLTKICSFNIYLRVIAAPKIVRVDSWWNTDDGFLHVILALILLFSDSFLVSDKAIWC
jgi:hypothetical protein